MSVRSKVSQLDPRPDLTTILDLARWKKMNKIAPDAKLFICSNGYPALVQALLDRGWVRNKNLTSPHFDFKYTNQRKDIDFMTLPPKARVNHFTNTTCLTSKRGLCLTLKNLIWYRNIDIDNFFPRSFYMNEKGDYYDFIEEFKAIKTESVLKKFLIYVQQDKPIGEKFKMKI